MSGEIARVALPYREQEFNLDVLVTGGPGAVITNIFQLFGTVRVLEQVAEIKSITTLVNMTALYSDLWDGTVSVPLTANGIVLSGAPVGTVFTKDQDDTQPYTVSLADQCRLNETATDKRVGKPFTITQKNGVATYIRIRYSTTDAPLAFIMHLRFVWEPVNGGYLIEA